MLTFVCSLALIASVPMADVNVFVGTDGVGHTTPAAACPFGLVQAGPDTGNGSWDYCSGYQFRDRTLIGFSQTHLSGTGAADFGDVRLLPYVGEECPKSVPMDKSTERAEPGFYAVTVGGVAVEIAAAPHAAVYRLRYPEGTKASVALDPATGLYRSPREAPKVPFCDVRQVAPQALAGTYRRQGWGDRTVGFRIESSVPFSFVRTGGCGVFTWRIDFPAGTRDVRLDVALSAKSESGAERNLAAETRGKSFAEVRAAATAAWNEVLGRLSVPDDPVRRRIFRTALYHVCFQPNLISDCGEEARYGTFSYWDTFRAAHPLYAELVPELVPAFVLSELDQFDRTGHLSSWSLWGRDVQCMIATHSVPVLVDAVLRGLVDAPVAARVYAAVKDTLTKPHADRVKENWDLLDRYGYLPFDVVSRESSSRTLEGAYDDICAARLAERLGHAEDAAFFRKRAACWRNVFDTARGYARPRLASGVWAEPFDPTDCGAGFGFTEGNAEHYSWHVLHDLSGLVEAMGGREKTLDRLDRLFALPSGGRNWTRDLSGAIGQYVHGNEPCHHVPFVPAALGDVETTARRVREIQDRLYRDAPDGLCGNDDCGQLSAWYAFAELGRYPVDPCGGEFVRFRPAGTKVPGAF